MGVLTSQSTRYTVGAAEPMRLAKPRVTLSTMATNRAVPALGTGMPARYPNTGQAQGNYVQTLMSWGSPTPIPSAEAFAEIEIVRRWALRSPTARQIIEKVDQSPTVINIVCFRRQGETVFSSDDPAPGQGTIFWDTESRFQTKQEAGAAPLHHFIAFLHEMGHAVQWMENPVFFNGNMLHGKTGENAIKDAAQKFFRAKALKLNPSANFKEQNQFADQYMRHGQNRMARPAWSVRVEMDNLIRHEWPICDEAGFPRRLGYTDLVMSYDSPFKV